MIQINLKFILNLRCVFSGCTVTSRPTCTIIMQHQSRKSKYIKNLISNIQHVVVLQNGLGLIKDGPDSENEANETKLNERTDEGNMKVEFDIKVEETLYNLCFSFLLLDVHS